MIGWKNQTRNAHGKQKKQFSERTKTVRVKNNRKLQKEEFNPEAEDIKAFVHEDTTTKFSLLRSELNKQIDKISEIKNSVSIMRPDIPSIEDSIISCLLYTSVSNPTH